MYNCFHKSFHYQTLYMTLNSLGKLVINNISLHIQPYKYLKVSVWPAGVPQSIMAAAATTTITTTTTARG